MDKRRTISKDLVLVFGDREDGVIGIPEKTSDGFVIEASYFFGKKYPKNIIAISSQAGCPMRCHFCELGAERFGRNLTPQEMLDQVHLVLEEAARYGFDERLPHKISIANSGEPLFNPNLITAIEQIGGLPKTIKISTVFPETRTALDNFERLAEYAGAHPVPIIQIQISLISTSESYRRRTAGLAAAGFHTIRDAAVLWRKENPHGRKINLSLMLARDIPCSARDAVSLFPSDLFRIRLRPYVETKHGRDERLISLSLEERHALKGEFSAAGYEVDDYPIPTPTESKFDLVANGIRQKYLSMIHH
ncbi:MAG TPA: radical SAM protein [Patescibacteria group bacterium]|nr:radical SAM protein [Patescibacteria group bacterium]